MRALVVGASGLLGNALYRELLSRGPARGTYKSFPAGGLEPLDVLDPGAVEAALSKDAPDTVFFPAADPHVDRCERDPRGSRRLNVDATLAFAESALGKGARFVFFSTDYVFDGEKPVYREEDEARPLSEYGRQKLEVERALSRFGERALVLRVCGLFGWEPRPKNFVLQILGRLGRGEALTLPGDQDYTPTYAPQAAATAVRLAELGAWGLYHLAGPDTATRAGLARGVARAFGLDESLVSEASAASLQAPDRARRPLHSSLDSGRAAALLGAPLWGLERSLEHMRSAQAAWKAHGAGLR